MTSTPPDGQPVDAVDAAVDAHGRGAVAGVEDELEALLLVDDLADARELAVPEVVQEPADAPPERLLGGLVAERGRVPVGREVPLQVLARGRRLPAGDALATLAGEGLERRVGGRAEGERAPPAGPAPGSGRRS